MAFISHSYKILRLVDHAWSHTATEISIVNGRFVGMVGVFRRVQMVGVLRTVQERHFGMRNVRCAKLCVLAGIFTPN